MEFDPHAPLKLSINGSNGMINARGQSSGRESPIGIKVVKSLIIYATALQEEGRCDTLAQICLISLI